MKTGSVAYGSVVDIDEHDNGPGHPERPARLVAVEKGLELGDLSDALVALPRRIATRAELERVHDPGRPAFVVEAGRDAALLVGEGIDVEHAGDALASLHLAQQHLPAVRRETERERGRDRGLAGAALAGHDVQTHARPVGKVLRRSHGAERR